MTLCEAMHCADNIKCKELQNDDIQNVFIALTASSMRLELNARSHL